MASAVEKLIQLDKAKPKCILVIGDVLTDIWIYGEMLSCQDSCNMFKEQHRIRVPGGAANAANSLMYWNSEVKLFGARQFGAKTRYINKEKIVFRHDEEVLATDFVDIHTRALSNVNKADAVLLCDYDKGFLTENFIQRVIKRAKLCVVDVKREPSLFAGALLKCNKLYSEKYSINARGVITDGANLPIELATSRRLGKVKSPVSCINHVGAGDCFSAHLTLGLAHDLSLEEAATVAHSASRVYVQHRHNRAPVLKEIIED